MAAIPENYTITESGDYDIPGLKTSNRYLICAKTEDKSGANLKIQFPIGVDGAFVDCDNGSLLADTEVSEARIYAPETTMRLSVSEIVEPIKITIITLPPGA